MRRLQIPRTRDPFINTPLLPLARQPGEPQRFWISSYNSAAGSTGVLVDENGKSRVYRFELPHCGFYSAAQVDDDTLWLCGDLSRVVRLTLSTGDIAVHETGAPPGLVFKGMACDLAEGKLYAAALGSGWRTSWAFDYRNGVTAAIHADVTPDHYTKASFPNGDGTHTIIVCVPGLSLLRWDPVTDAVEVQALTRPEQENLEWAGLRGLDRLIADEDGRRFLPGWGWYDPAERAIVDGPEPKVDLTWFGRIGNTAWGVDTDGSTATVSRWNLETGAIGQVCKIPDLAGEGITLSDSGKVVAVNVYGEFFRFDARIGALELTRRLETDSRGLVYHVRRIDDDRLLGAPFITQRFWELRLSDGTGTDLGRAAPGAGEVKLSWAIGGKVYFAAYVNGVLTEYSPDGRAAFPENPRVVAITPNGMRPTSGTDDGVRLFYACSRSYGELGCTLTRYDTESGEATYLDDPLAGLAIRTLHWQARTARLVAGTSIDGDNQSATREREAAAIARIDPETLLPVEQHDLEPGVEEVSVVGPIDDESYLCVARLGGAERRWFVFSTTTSKVPTTAEMTPLAGDSGDFIATARPRLFIRATGDRYDLWEMPGERLVKTLCDDPEVDRCHTQDNAAYLITPKEILLVEPLFDDLRGATG
ncbi:hypothetical protein ABZ897_42020 [Nonomuraea sp. NPDC046802]|uniref:hypothetical protein n=1 Tax=Nonomuraea sp. NPDC046802 TaxID=3154919 RepID=UPI003410A527